MKRKEEYERKRKRERDADIYQSITTDIEGITKGKASTAKRKLELYTEILY